MELILKAAFERDVDLVLVRAFYEGNSVARLFLDTQHGRASKCDLPTASSHLTKHLVFFGNIYISLEKHWCQIQKWQYPIMTFFLRHLIQYTL